MGICCGLVPAKAKENYLTTMVVRAGRSLKASPEGIKRANKAVLIFATKIDLAAELEISRATVQNFFAGKPVGRENFHKICQKLELPWQEVADLPKDEEPPHKEWPTATTYDLDGLVQHLRYKVNSGIVTRCGMMRVLDMSQPMELSDFYTNVNVLEKISGRRRLKIADLLKMCAPDEFERPGFGRITQERVPGLEALQKYPKLIVLGKPGAGKTTFLKHVALQCIKGELEAHRVPIFVTLKDFAETERSPSLLEYINDQFASCGVSDTAHIKEVLSRGRALVLLDGLDEVRESDSPRVLKEVRHFAAQFHGNQFVLSCRIAAREYTFEEFTEVEVADFDQEQVASFAIKWFAHKDPRKSLKFLEKLQENRRIWELATNPLLLTLLCLMFEESADFPANRAELYKEGLNVLLRKWDAKRNIEREPLYKKLSLQHKEDLLGQIAFSTFERGDYFFSQKEIEQQIADYIRHLPIISGDELALQLDSEALLKSIEAQHGLLVERARGIYSFSHLTFQEYFTAREIVSISEPQALERALKQLVGHMNEKRWREVFLLSVGMLRNADYMLQLMKQHIDRLVATDGYLQGFVGWVNQKALSVRTSYKPMIVRAFYFDLALAGALNLVGGSLNLAIAIDRNLTRSLDSALALDLALDRTLALERTVDRTVDPSRAIDSVLARAIGRAHSVDPQLERSLQQLKAELEHPDEDPEEFPQWWKAHGGAWTEQLRAVMIEQRNIGHNWRFNHQQRKVLQQYYEANQLLVDCLNSNCYVTLGVRQEIEETLLLPRAEIQALSA